MTMFLTLTAGGLIEGFSALNLVPRETILTSMKPFWFVRSITGVSIIVGTSCLVTNMVMTAVRGRSRHIDTDYAPYETADLHQRDSGRLARDEFLRADLQQSAGQ